MEFTFQLNEISTVAHQLVLLFQHPLICLEGEMGAGKTTLIKAICEVMGVKSPVSSPTFSLVNEYESNAGILFHFDLYRLKEETEALDFGIEDYLDSGNYCFIEWFDKIPNLLPAHYHLINISIVNNNTRKITFFTL
ncbi:MAG: tRNA (adenosine(37)-N6)-threonylcarbamoyltransferase complex ATPase subunit type 1 TsaE [Flavobacterium sp.]